MGSLLQEIKRRHICRRGSSEAPHNKVINQNYRSFRINKYLFLKRKNLS
jgi:hypothetical protein